VTLFLTIAMAVLVALHFGDMRVLGAIVLLLVLAALLG